MWFDSVLLNSSITRFLIDQSIKPLSLATPHWELFSHDLVQWNLRWNNLSLHNIIPWISNKNNIHNNERNTYIAFEFLFSKSMPWNEKCMAYLQTQSIIMVNTLISMNSRVLHTCLHCLKQCRPLAYCKIHRRLPKQGFSKLGPGAPSGCTHWFLP